MYTTKHISETQLNELKKLIETASPPIGKQLDKVLRAPAIGQEYHHRFDSSLVNIEPIGTTNNPELLQWLEDFTGIDSSFVNHIHINHMKEKGYLLSHTDPYHLHGSDTFVFLLEKPEVGGVLILDGRVIDVNQDTVVIFNGMKYHHEVTKINKGNRESFIVFYNHPDNSSSKNLF